MDKERKKELNSVIKFIVFSIRDSAQNDYDNNSDATGMSGSHGNLDKRIGRLLREYKNTVTINQAFNNIIIGNQTELNYVKNKLSARAKKFEHDGKEKNHPFK